MLDLVKAVENGLRNIPDEWDKSSLHISDLGSAIPGEGCLREVYYRLNRYDGKELTTGQRFMFQQGHRIHEYIPKIWELPDGCRVSGIEQVVKLYGLIGRADCVLLSPCQEIVVVDFKTVRGNAFNYLTEPKPSHVAQLQGYIMALNADYGILLYIDREGQNGLRQFHVERDDDSTIERCRTLLKLHARLTAPPTQEPKVKLRKNKNDHAIYVNLPWMCDYCQYCDISCPGAIPQEHRTSGVCGHAWWNETEDDRELEVQLDKEYDDEVMQSILDQISSKIGGGKI